LQGASDCSTGTGLGYANAPVSRQRIMSPLIFRRAFLAIPLALGFGRSLLSAPAPKQRLIGVLSTGHIEAAVQTSLESRLRVAIADQAMHMTFEFREASFDQARLVTQIDELLSKHPEVLVCLDLFAATTAKSRRGEGDPPIVFLVRADPLAASLIQSYSHPGGNLTGVTTYRCIDEKMIEIIADAFPRRKRLGYLIDASVEEDAMCIALAEATAARLQIELIKIDVSPPNFIANLGASLKSLQLMGLVAPASAPLWQNRKVVVETINSQRLPAIYESTLFLDEGGLMSYGSTGSDSIPPLVDAIHKVLQGEAAGGIPVEQPMHFELVINLKAPHAVEFDIKAATLRRADRILE
jgi:putative tryptophan/tyrosine transport system substrate-binding protein